MSNLYIGLMSGTSLDGIDAVLVDLDTNPDKNSGINIICSHYQAYSDQQRSDLHALCRGTNNEIQLYASLDSQLGQMFADAVHTLLKNSKTKAADVLAIGSHGQTIRHYPDATQPNSLQIGNPNIIAEQTGIAVIADFRRRDMAAGGHGAPLVPAFHAAQFQNTQTDRAILNIGGIANLTLLPADNNHLITGWDTGPGNTLMDAWINRHTGSRQDTDGLWAAQGTISEAFINRALNDNYFALAAPKSTGPEYFNLNWLDALLTQLPATLSDTDVQASLCQLTALSVANDINRYAPTYTEIMVCGGGTHNPTLMRMLTEVMPDKIITTTAEHGLHPDLVEAVAFAWLAKQSIEGQAGNLPAVTGAKHPVILGALYPA